MKTPNLTVRQKGHLVVVDLSESVNQTEGHQAFRETIGRLSKDRAGRILVNMAGITELSQIGLRALVDECAGFAGAGKLKFFNVNGKVKARLKKVGLYDVFATQEEYGWDVRSTSATAASLTAPGSEYFFG